ncbi:MAG: BtpA/SgcQ family protein, partial [Dongiaceae bacterium]
MKDLFQRDFGRRRFVIGMVHTLGLPGAPRYDRAGGMRRIVAQAQKEARVLADSGFHALLFCNESDMPYQMRMPAEAVAAMTEAIAEVTARVRLPHGVNMLLDPAASIAIAHATG